MREQPLIRTRLSELEKEAGGRIRPGPLGDVDYKKKTFGTPEKKNKGIMRLKKRGVTNIGKGKPNPKTDYCKKLKRKLQPIEKCQWGEIGVWKRGC